MSRVSPQEPILPQQRHHLNLPDCTHCHTTMKWICLSQIVACACGVSSPGRWECVQCRNAACSGCVSVPTIGGHCPLLHPLKYYPGDGRHCDNCHSLIAGKCYRDLYCKFDLCLYCFKTVQQED